MKRTIFCLLLLTGCNLLAPPPRPPLELSLSATATEGVAPLSVTFVVTSTPAPGAVTWTVGGQRASETRSTLTHTFTEAGLYVVSAAAGGGSASVTLSVRRAAGPSDPGPSDLTLSATPTGPAPWGVAYTVTPAVDGLQARCTEGATYNQVTAGRFACLHEPGDVAEVRFVAEDGEVGARERAAPDIAERRGVVFAGRWRYRARGVEETFRISEGDTRLGRSADGRFRLFTVRQNGVTVAELTLDGRTVVLEPIPDPDGRQRFVARVYGLELEQLALPEEVPE